MVAESMRRVVAWTTTCIDTFPGGRTTVSAPCPADDPELVDFQHRMRREEYRFTVSRELDPQTGFDIVTYTERAGRFVYVLTPVSIEPSTCPSCHGTGYEAVAEDEVAPCSDIRCTVRDNDPVNDYGIRRSEWMRMAARDLVEADGYRWSDRDSHRHYRGIES